MAFQVGNTFQYDPTSSTTTTFACDTTKLPAFVSGDWILFAVSWTGTATVTDGSWGTNVTKATSTSGGVSLAWFYKKASGTTIASPTLTASGATNWCVQGLVIRGADGTNFLSGTSGVGYIGAVDDSNSNSSSTTGTITPAQNNCLLLAQCGQRNGYYSRFKSQDWVGIGQQVDGSLNLGQSLGSRQQITAAAQGATTYYIEFTSRSTSLVIAIRDDGGAKLNSDCRAQIDRINWYGSFGQSNDSLTWAAAGPSSMAGGALTSINGISTSSTNLTKDNTINLYQAIGSFSQFTSNENTAGLWSGAYHTFAAKDLRGYISSIEYSQIQSLGNFLGSEGIIEVWVDGSNNWAAFQLTKKTGWPQQLIFTAFVSLETGTQYASGGTIDWSNITQRGFMVHRVNSSSTARNWGVRNGLLHKSSSLVGGCSASPLNLAYLDKALNGWGYMNLDSLQGGVQIIGNTPIQIGDGSTPTYYDGSTPVAIAYASLSAYDPTTQRNWNVPAGTTGIAVYASASDTMNFTASSLVAAEQQPFGFNASTSGSATYSFNGEALIGHLPTWNTNVPCAGMTFKGCGKVDAAGATFTNCSFETTTATDAPVSFSASSGTLSGCTTDVTGTSAAYHIALGTSVTSVTLTDHTFTGSAGTNKVHVLKTSGTVTININGTTSLSSGEVTSAGATVSIVSAPVYQKVIVTGFINGSRIQIYDTTSSTELFNGTSSSGNTVISGTTATWTDPSAATANRAIRVRVALQTTVTAKNFIDTSGLTCGTTAGIESVTYPITQTDDTTYNSNGIDGSTVPYISITVGPSEVNINVPGGIETWPNIYAYQVYWQFTSTGIAQETAFINGVDTANYIVTTFQITNTDTGALQLIGGWGRDSVTGTVAGCINVAGSSGNIYAEPDHVVAFATGSALTAGQAAQLAAIYGNADATTSSRLSTANFIGLK